MSDDFSNSVGTEVKAWVKKHKKILIASGVVLAVVVVLALL